MQDMNLLWPTEWVGLNSKFSFSQISYHTKIKEFSLPNYLHINKGRIVWFQFFQLILVLWEIQIASSRIRTWLTEYSTSAYIIHTRNNVTEKINP